MQTQPTTTPRTLRNPILGFTATPKTPYYDSKFKNKLKSNNKR